MPPPGILDRLLPHPRTADALHANGVIPRGTKLQLLLLLLSLGPLGRDASEPPRSRVLETVTHSSSPSPFLTYSLE